MLDARDLPDGQRLTADICIVGAGAAGIALAMEFVGTGIDVLVLESGDLRVNREAQNLNFGTVVDDRLHHSPDVDRRRRLGGSTTESESRYSALPPTDFEQRSHMPNSGWPFGAETLRPFYERALALCASEESLKTFERDQEILSKPLIEGFDDFSFSTDGLDHYSHREDFGKRFGASLRAANNVCVLLNATVTRIQLNAAGTAVETLNCRTLTGKAISVTATRIVIAAGAMETARLLLANRDVHPKGIGNDSDNVGRYYMCPAEGIIGEAVLNHQPTTAWYGDGKVSAVRSRRRVTLKPENQRLLQIGNFVAWLRPLDWDGGRSGGLLSNLLRKRLPGKRFAVEFQSEQQANISSRVLLGDDLDALGMPRLIVDWRANVSDFETIRLGIAILAADLERSGAGHLHYEASTLAAMMSRRGVSSGHHLGTARMGCDARSSVVDANCRIHGVGNLYVAGGAVFPTSGLGDPTLTLVALSLRLGDHLKLLETQGTQSPRSDTRLVEVHQARSGGKHTAVKRPLRSVG